MFRALLASLALAACAAATPAPAPGPVEAKPAAFRLPVPAEGEHFGIYLLGQKAGWGFLRTWRVPYGSGSAILSESQVVLSVSAGGNPVERTVIDRRWYEDRPGGRLLAFEAIRQGDGGDRTLTATCDRERCATRLSAGAGEERRTIPLPPETVEAAVPERLAAQGGKDVTVSYLDLDELVVHRAVYRRAAAKDGVVEVRSHDEGKGVDSVYRIEGERLLELSLGPAMLLKAEKEPAAKATGAPMELFAATKVPLPAPLREGASEVRLVVEGLTEGFWRKDARQRYEALPGNRTRITLSAVTPKAAGRLPVDAAAFAAELAPTPTIDADAPAIRALAKELVPVPGDARAAVEKLVAYVHGALDKGYGTSSDRASRVLETRRGDCTEHALLFTALARAAGIPARTVHGLVFADVDGSDSLFWHEWAEVWTGEWIAVDPTFGQTVADATHLALGEGRQDRAILLVGQLKVLESAVVR